MDEACRFAGHARLRHGVRTAAAHRDRFPAGRRHRHGGPHPCTEDVGEHGPARRRGEPSRRWRRARHGSRGEKRARRPYGVLRHDGQPCGQSGLPAELAFQCRARSRPRHPSRVDVVPALSQSGPAGEHGARADRLRESQSGQAQLLLERQRRRAPTSLPSCSTRWPG